MSNSNKIFILACKALFFSCTGGGDRIIEQQSSEIDKINKLEDKIVKLEARIAKVESQQVVPEN